MWIAPRLTEESQTRLREYADWLRHDVLQVMLEGHCDERGTEAYNLMLGERRAGSVKAYLTHLGIPANRLIGMSYGKAKPVCSAPEESCYRLNRRVRMVIKEDPRPPIALR